MSPIDYVNELMYMPAVIMAKAAPVPEPSAVVLAVGGLSGLLAYAWRKRK